MSEEPSFIAPNEGRRRRIDGAPAAGERRRQEARSFQPEDEAQPLAGAGRSAWARPDAGVDIAAADDRAFAVIPCLNEAEHIGGLIAHLLDDADWRDPLVVVADGGSTDGTLDIVQAIALTDRRVRLLHNPHRLQSAGVNLAAVQYGKGRRWMVRVDAHAGYPDRYVSRLLSEGRAKGAASVVVAMTTQGRGGFQTAAAAAQNSVLGAGGSAHRCGGRSGWVDHGHHALFDLDHFFGVGGYDESFGANEDAEFDVRLGKAKGRIWLSPDVRITYYPRRTAGGLFRQYLSYGKGRARTLLTHRIRPKVRQLLPVAVAPAVLLAPLGVSHPILGAPAALWAAGALVLGVMLGVKKRDAAACASGAAAMVMHLGWSLGFWWQLLTPRRPAAAARVRTAEGLN
jgi:succinoglycan biosynthesis protein ExoA